MHCKNIKKLKRTKSIKIFDKTNFTILNKQSYEYLVSVSNGNIDFIILLFIFKFHTQFAFSVYCLCR